MGSDLHNSALFHNHNLVRVLYGRKTMGNNQAGSVFHQLYESVLYALLGSGVNRGGCLVQNQYFRVCHNGSCYVYQLPLSVGQARSRLLEECFIFVFHSPDKGSAVACAGGAYHSLIVSFRVAVFNIVFDGV